MLQAPSPSPSSPAAATAYYRGAQGIILVYDVTRRETFESLEEVWLREVDMYATVEDAVKMVVANKTDLVGCWVGSRVLVFLNVGPGALCGV